MRFGLQRCMCHPHERRYLADPIEVEILLVQLGETLVEQIWDPLRPRTFIRTTYLDTPDLEYLAWHEAELPRSVRVRRYATAGPDGHMELADPCVLELKESSETDRRKLRIPLPPALVPELIAGRDDLLYYVEPELLEVAALTGVAEQLRERRLAPTITTWCRRRSFLADGGCVRLTIDQRICYGHACRADLDGDCPRPARIFRRADPMIVEVKWRGDRPIWLLEALAPISSATAFTKYRSGMELSAHALARLAA